MMLRLASFFLIACAMLSAQTPAPPTGKLDLEVMTAAADQKPIAGASVNWIGPDNTSHTDLTGKDGHLRLSGLVPGVYTIRGVSAAGYSNAVRGSAVGPVYVPADNTAVIQSLMIPNGAIEGTVVDEDSKPISGAIVVAHSYPLDSPGLERLDSVGTAVTGPEGRYLIPDRAPQGSTSAFVSHLGGIVMAYLPVERAIELGKGFEPAYSDKVVVHPGLTETVDIQLHSRPTFHIRGLISGKARTEGTFVSIQNCSKGTEDKSAMRTAVAKDGSFDAAGFIPGAYCLTFEVAQGTDYKPQSYGFATSSDHDVDQVQLKASQ
jgi:hypothetical protein